MSIQRFFWKDIDSLAFYDQRTLAKYIGVEFQLHTTIDDVAVRVPMTLQSLVDILPLTPTEPMAANSFTCYLRLTLNKRHSPRLCT